MSKLLSQSLKRFLAYAGLVLACSIPVYYVAISLLWKYELKEHNIVLSPEAGREDSFLIIGSVTLLTVIFFIVLLSGFLILNRNISRRLWQPFYSSLGKIRNFDLNQQMAIDFELTEIEEFAELNQTLSKLISGNIAVYARQKEFADNASHELQTPLAIVQSKLDMLLQSESLTSEDYKFIEDALQALTRVKRINKNLLLLAKIENSQFMEKERINLSALLETAIPLFNNFAEDKQIKLQASILPDVLVEGNKILIEIVLNNLLTNAIRHSVFNDMISIHLLQNLLIIKNPGMAPLQPERLFKRFATTSPQTPGTGLGLALVKDICGRYDWVIQYAFINSTHTFTIQF